MIASLCRLCSVVSSDDLVGGVANPRSDISSFSPPQSLVFHSYCDQLTEVGVARVPLQRLSPRRQNQQQQTQEETSTIRLGGGALSTVPVALSLDFSLRTLPASLTRGSPDGTFCGPFMLLLFIRFDRILVCDVDSDDFTNNKAYSRVVILVPQSTLLPLSSSIVYWPCSLSSPRALARSFPPPPPQHHHHHHHHLNTTTTRTNPPTIKHWHLNHCWVNSPTLESVL
jgi:hypothetical protein